MIVEFTIKNYRSIKDEQTFSFYAGDYKTEFINKKNNELPDNIFYMPNKQKGSLGILKVAAIYGANASGKSNVLGALRALTLIVEDSGDWKDKETIKAYAPYRLSEATKKAPTRFEIEFFCDIPSGELGCKVDSLLRFVYQIEFSEREIISESLDFFPNKLKANLFRRERYDTWETIKFGNYYKGGKRKLPFFANNSYLSKAGNDASSPKFIRAIYNYFRTGLFHILNNGIGFNLSGIVKFGGSVNEISKILNLVDTGVQGIEFKKKSDILLDKDIYSIFPEQFKKSLEQAPEFLRNEFLEAMSNEVLFKHQGASGIIEYFKEEDLSGGTLKLFNFLPILFLAFRQRTTVIIDELETNFHPHIAELIIKLFNDEKVNKKGAQLIFSTHSTDLMDNDLLRRDQIWFTEKLDGKTVLFSLSDFDSKKIRANSPYAKWYIDGRFGAIPRFNYLEIANILTNLVDSGDDKEKA